MGRHVLDGCAVGGYVAYIHGHSDQRNRATWRTTSKPNRSMFVWVRERGKQSFSPERATEDGDRACESIEYNITHFDLDLVRLPVCGWLYFTLSWCDWREKIENRKSHSNTIRNRCVSRHHRNTKLLSDSYLMRRPHTTRTQWKMGTMTLGNAQVKHIRVHGPMRLFPVKALQKAFRKDKSANACRICKGNDTTRCDTIRCNLYLHFSCFCSAEIRFYSPTSTDRPSPREWKEKKFKIFKLGFAVCACLPTNAMAVLLFCQLLVETTDRYTLAALLRVSFIQPPTSTSFVHRSSSIVEEFIRKFSEWVFKSRNCSLRGHVFHSATGKTTTRSSAKRGKTISQAISHFFEIWWVLIWWTSTHTHGACLKLLWAFACMDCMSFSSLRSQRIAFLAVL